MNQYEYVTSKLGNDLNGHGALTISNQDGILISLKCNKEDHLKLIPIIKLMINQS